MVWITSSESEYIEYLNTLKPEDWSKLTAFIPEIEKNSEFAIEIDYTQREDYDENVIYLPSHRNAPIVNKFIHTFIEMNLQFGFNWTRWAEGKKIISNLNDYIDNLDLLTICKLFTALIRNERFCDGVVASCFKDGTILLLLKRLKFLTNT